MTVRLAINGFGRIGRLMLRRVLASANDVTPVAVNSPRGTPRTLAHLFKHDTVFGRWPGEVTCSASCMRLGDVEIPVLNEPSPARLPWGRLGVDVVAEATGVFRSRGEAGAHLTAGAARVVVAAPVEAADATIVVGVNDHTFDPDRHLVVSASSCTTNCVAPMTLVLHERFGLRSGVLTTVHAYTRDQELNDAFHEDLRRARAAAQNLIPTKTGAAAGVEAVLPSLAGRLAGLAVRVPVPDVSLAILAAVLERPAEAEDVNDALLLAADTPRLNGILAVSHEPLVSCDFIGDDRSCVVDAASTRTAPGHHVNVLAWYDNEWAYAARMVDLVRLVAGAAAPRLDMARAGLHNSWP